jgi:hypothetical protein
MAQCLARPAFSTAQRHGRIQFREDLRMAHHSDMFPGPSPDGLLACLRALAEEADALGLIATREAILRAAARVVHEAAERLPDHPGTARLLGAGCCCGLN